MEGIVSLLPLVAIALLFWLLIIRPASKRQKDQARMQSAIKEGEQVMLTSGIFGTVTELNDDRLSIEIAPGVVVDVARGAIGSVVPTKEPDEELVEEEPYDEYEEPTDGDAESEKN
ncbi:MAG TPA: preprotein translocase subunit YajC [Nocardioides sp.]|nr:preprotein translocase subunit YajC [Nocardioides sp.]